MRARARKFRVARPAAFTLIEALAVTALLAVLAAGAAVSLAGAARRARAQDVAGQLAAFDRATRDAARHFGRMPALRFDLNRGTVHRVDSTREAAPLRLGGAGRVKRVVTGGREARSGEVSVRFSTLGQSPSYAVLLAGADGERWVTFAGLTGQAVVSQDERDARNILAAAAGGADAP